MVESAAELTTSPHRHEKNKKDASSLSGDDAFKSSFSHVFSLISPLIISELRYRGLSDDLIKKISRRARLYGAPISAFKISLWIAMIYCYNEFLVSILNQYVIPFMRTHPEPSQISDAVPMPMPGLVGFIGAVLLVLSCYSFFLAATLNGPKSHRIAYGIVQTLNSLQMSHGSYEPGVGYRFGDSALEERARAIRSCRQILQKQAWSMASDIAILAGHFPRDRTHDDWSRLSRVIVWASEKPWDDRRRQRVMEACFEYAQCMFNGNVHGPVGIKLPKKVPSLSKPHGTSVGVTVATLLRDKALWVGILIAIATILAQKSVDAFLLMK